MSRLLLLISPLLFFSCQSNEKPETGPVFSTTDSTAIVQDILDSLESEMYLQWFMDTTTGALVCYNSPDFHPALFVKVDKQGKIMINDVLNPGNISDLVLRFYSANYYKNDITNNTPLYSRISKQYVIEQISDAENEFLSLINTPNVPPDLLLYKQKAIDELKDKLDLFRILSIDTLKEPHYTAGVKFDCPEDFKKRNQVLDSILLGFYKIRELDGQEYFSESYAKIFWKATKYKDPIALKKLRAFKILHPVNILDYEKSRYKPSIVPLPTPEE